MRDIFIDTLRFVGISLIILAHVSPPNIPFNIRCFDVPLMIFISGLIYADKNTGINFHFFIHRLKRLLIPLYLFLTIFFILIFFLKYIFKIRLIWNNFITCMRKFSINAWNWLCMDYPYFFNDSIINPIPYFI